MGLYNVAGPGQAKVKFQYQGLLHSFKYCLKLLHYLLREYPLGPRLAIGCRVRFF
mgnify:CR=1 FL=1